MKKGEPKIDQVTGVEMKNLEERESLSGDYKQFSEENLNSLESEIQKFLDKNSDKAEFAEKEKEKLSELRKQLEELRSDDLEGVKKVYEQSNDRLVDFLIIGGDSRYLVRRAAEVTIDRAGAYGDLGIKIVAGDEAENKKRSDEVFKQKTRELWQDFVVHGRLEADNEGKIGVVERSDLDGNTSLNLLKEAGIKVENVEYVAPGKRSEKEGKFHIDTGSVDGLVLVKDDKGRIIAVIVDHHGEMSGRDTSGAKWTYEILTSLGLLEKTENMDRLVNFVTDIDNGKYPDERRYLNKYYVNSWKTLNGLARMASWGTLKDFFAYRGGVNKDKLLSPANPMSDGLLKKFGFIGTHRGQDFDKSEKQRLRVFEEKDKIKKMEKNGLIIDSEKYGKICVNIAGQTSIGGSMDASKVNNFGVHVIWDPTAEKVFITTLNGKEIENNLGDQGKRMRGTMWVKGEGLITMRLRDVLMKMTDGKVRFEGELKEFLEKEERETEAIADYLDLARKSLRRIQEYIDGQNDVADDDNGSVMESFKEEYWKKLEALISKNSDITPKRAVRIVEHIKGQV